MKKYSQILILFALLSYLGCQREEVQPPKLFSCKDFRLNVPIESVDEKTNGEKSGDTHFHSHSSDSEIFYSYQVFESDVKAVGELKQNEKNSMRVLRKGELIHIEGRRIGEKVVFFLGK